MNILLTGASRGIGKAIKDELQKKGYNCITPTREELDLNNPKNVDKYLKSIKDVEVHGIINNAGVNILASLEEIDDKKIDIMMNVNLISPLKLIKGIVPQMKERKEGKIVNISSIWGVRGKERRLLYSITKFGIIGMTRALARELGEFNILVNAVAPGYVDTEMTRKNLSEIEQNIIKKSIPLKRFADPSEIAKLITFLISEDNTYITGETILIDGGFLA